MGPLLRFRSYFGRTGLSLEIRHEPECRHVSIGFKTYVYVTADAAQLGSRQPESGK